MADHSKPTTASSYTNFVSEMSGRFNDVAAGLDPAYVTPTNTPTNALRFSSAAAKWQRWNGTAWVDAATLYSISISGNAATVTNGVVTTGSYADPSWITSLAGTKVTGNISGNAGSATVLQTARTINGVSFNGSANISVNVNSNLTFTNAGGGAASGATFNGGSPITVSYNSVGAPSSAGVGATGTWDISITGNAATATSAVSATNATNATNATTAATATNALNLNNQPGSYYQQALGFTPVQQGGGTGQLTNKVYLGWSGSRLKAQVDTTDLGGLTTTNDFVASVGTNGYQKLPGGLIIQWGYSTGWSRVTFPIAFNNVYSVNSTFNFTAANQQHEHGVTSVSTTGFDPFTNANTSPFFWIATGN